MDLIMFLSFRAILKLQFPLEKEFLKANQAQYLRLNPKIFLLSINLIKAILMTD